MTTETCPLCLGRGTKRKADGGVKVGKMPPERTCVACNGDGFIPRRRLQAIVRRGVKAMRGE